MFETVHIQNFIWLLKEVHVFMKKDVFVNFTKSEMKFLWVLINKGFLRPLKIKMLWVKTNVSVKISSKP